jgi:hypothetical protein
VVAPLLEDRSVPCDSPLSMCCSVMLCCSSCSVTGPLRVDFTWFDPTLGYSSSEARAAFRRTLNNHQRDDWGRASGAASGDQGLGGTSSRIGGLLSARAASGVAAASLAAAAAATADGVNASLSQPPLRTTMHKDTGHSSSSTQYRSFTTSIAQYASYLQDLGANSPLSPLSPLSPQPERAGVVWMCNGLMFVEYIIRKK